MREGGWPGLGGCWPPSSDVSPEMRPSELMARAPASPSLSEGLTPEPAPEVGLTSSDLRGASVHRRHLRYTANMMRHIAQLAAISSLLLNIGV